MECPLKEPSLEFRKYQKDVLEQVDLSEKEIMIVAPPGSGKTIVGLELIRRIGSPAIVFAPTTIIARQWKEKASFFCKKTEGAVSLESDIPAFLNIFTYQRISNRSEATEGMSKIAREMWSKELQKTLPLEEAEAEIERTRKKNPAFYKKRIASFISKLRTQYDRSAVESGLHKNAKELISQMKQAGVKVIVLDECHHLLDYWGLVIKYLKDVLGAKVIGLTATYPIAEEKDAFFELFSEQVDYEVSVPAVVKEGFLAPYRELAYLVMPTKEEVDMIKSEIMRLDNVLNNILSDPMFPEFCKWAQDNELFKENYPLYSVIIGGGFENLNYDRKLILIKGFLDYAYPIMEEGKRAQTFHLLRSSGITYGDRTMDLSRSIEKYTLSYSESRIDGAIKVLQEESNSQGDNLRALVMADFDMHVPSRKIKPGKVMGSATFIFLKMLRQLDKLDPVLVTGNRLYCDDDIAERFLSRIKELAKAKKLNFTVKAKHSEGIAIIEGCGKDWKPSTYTLLVTELFSEGLTKLLIGTKGIFGEGWDSLKLNTLIDLTAISYGTSVQQIKGRTLRLDPANPKKVSNNWDIVCVYPGMGSQISKLSRKHNLVYGVDDSGKITKGLSHIDRWIRSVPDGPSEPILFSLELGAMNGRMLKRGRERGKTASLWAVGAPYEDEEVPLVETKMKKKLVSVKTMGWFFSIFYLFLTSSIVAGIYAGLRSGNLLICIGVQVLVALFIMVVSSAAYIYLLRKPVPDEDILNGIAKATYFSLKKLGLSDDSATLKVSLQEDGAVEVALCGKGGREFSSAINELLSRPVNPRYVILYDVSGPVDAIPGVHGILSIAAEQAGIKKQYFAVPSVFAANKQNMAVFSREWQKHVGGGRFVYTRSEEGSKLLGNLVHAGISDWLADASEKIYWNYFGSEGSKGTQTFF